MYVILGKTKTICQVVCISPGRLRMNAAVYGFLTHHLGGKMKSKIDTLIAVAVIFVAFSVSSSAKGVQTISQRFPILVQGDRLGPMCFPSAGCAYKNSLAVIQMHRVPVVLLTDGGGPMCIPHTVCGYKIGVVPEGSRFPAAVLLTDGPGPMCFPSTGCGYRDGVFANGEDFPAAVLLTDGPGPMCFPHTGCGYKDAAVKYVR
jgi:hypothetical protein